MSGDLGAWQNSSKLCPWMCTVAWARPPVMPTYWVPFSIGVNVVPSPGLSLGHVQFSALRVQYVLSAAADKVASVPLPRLIRPDAPASGLTRTISALTFSLSRPDAWALLLNGTLPSLARSFSRVIGGWYWSRFGAVVRQAVPG